MARDRDRSVALEIGGTLSKAIKANRLSVAKAARILGVSRQSLYQYLRGKAVPGMDVLHRACIAWNINIEYRGILFGIVDSAHGTGKHQGRDVQLQLPQVLRSLHNRDLKVKLLKKSPSAIDLKLTIQIAGGTPQK